jgi:probable blue pigment (indigoidine) exporter
MRGYSSKTIFIGVVFAMLWASASAVGKYAIQSVEPLVLFSIRFLIAGILMIGYAVIVKHEALPSGKEWKPLIVFGLFNTTLYLGIFIVSLQFITAGITALTIALNPVLISMLSSLSLKRKVTTAEWLSIAIGTFGVGLATYPLLISNVISWIGVVLLLLCMVAYSYGSVYYSSVQWKLSRLSINGWQVFLGGLMLLPFTIYFYKGTSAYDFKFWLFEFCLVIPVSVISVQLWLYLIQADTVRASMWLFLCPIFGLIYSAFLLREPFSVMTAAGAVLVLASLYIGQRPQQIQRK